MVRIPASLALVLGEARVAADLLGVDAVAFGAPAG